MTSFTRDLAKIILRDALKVSPNYYSQELCSIHEQATGKEPVLKKLSLRFLILSEYMSVVSRKTNQTHNSQE